MSTQALMPISTPDEQARARDYAKKMQTALLRIGFWKSCINCEHWTNPIQRADDPAKGPLIVPLCRKYNALPPPDVIVVSCESWFSAVPF